MKSFREVLTEMMNIFPVSCYSFPYLWYLVSTLLEHDDVTIMERAYK